MKLYFNCIIFDKNKNDNPADKKSSKNANEYAKFANFRMRISANLSNFGNTFT